MAAYAGVFRFCFGVVRSSGCCPAAAAAAAQRPGGCRPDPGSSRPSSRPAGGQLPLGGRAASASSKRLLACARTDAATGFQMPMCFSFAADFASHVAASMRPGSGLVHDAGLSPCARNTIREAISRDTSSSQHVGHAVRRNRTRSAAGTFSGHRQRSRWISHHKIAFSLFSIPSFLRAQVCKFPVLSAPSARSRQPSHNTTTAA